LEVMKIEDLVQVEQFCLYHAIEPSFIQSLGELGLVEIIVIESNLYIHQDHTGDLERILRLHNELGINMEGIDAIAHLLEKVRSLQEELRIVKNRLRLYEDQ